MAVYYIADRTVMQLTDRSGATVPEALLVHAIPEVVSAEAPWGVSARRRTVLRQA